MRWGTSAYLATAHPHVPVRGVSERAWPEGTTHVVSAKVRIEEESHCEAGLGLIDR